MSDCACEPTELERAVAEVIQASADNISELVGRIEALEAPGEGEPIVASPEDTADSRVRELENRVSQLEEALSALIVESTPNMEAMDGQ